MWVGCKCCTSSVQALLSVMRWSSTFTTHRPHTALTHSSRRSYRAKQQPCWSRMPVAFSVRVRVLLGEEESARQTDSVRWMRVRVLAGAAMDARDLGVQASLAASQTLDRCAGMGEGSRRV
jgi:NhaP-type Na+/H+ or K+/H+ antiporter